MEMNETNEGGRTVLVLQGRLDTATAPAIEERLLGLIGQGGVIADLSAVRYVSSAGLRVLLKAAKQAKQAGHPFALVGLQEAVREVFEISGFDRIIPAFDSRAAALAG